MKSLKSKFIVSVFALGLFAIAGYAHAGTCLPTDPASITITSPNGGEVYSAGQKVTLKWTSCNIPATQKLYLGLTWSTDKFGEAGGVVNSDTPILNDGNETYTLPASVGGPGDYYQSGAYYKFMIYKALSNGNVGVQYDISDNPFTIQATPIKLTSPNSGTFTPGQTVTLTWTGGEASAPVRISLIKVSPFQVYTVITDTAPNTGSYNWTIPANIQTNEYQFYVQVNRGKVGSTWNYGGKITIAYNLASSLFMTGGINTAFNRLNDMYVSSDGLSWNKVTQNTTNWGPRMQHSMLYYKNAIWLSGGADGYDQELWKYDGINWIKQGVIPSAGADHGIGLVVFNGYIYAIGGSDHDGNLTNEVWKYDGTTWTKETNAPWSPRRYFNTVVYQNKIWIFKGDNAGGEIWSYDGSNWNQYTGSVPVAWVNNQNQSDPITVFDDGNGEKVYFAGGSDSYGAPNKNVWTFDGTNMTSKAVPQWKARSLAKMYTVNGKLFITGGGDNTNPNSAVTYNDIWSTTDGNNWTLESSNSSWSPRWGSAIIKP